MILATPGYPEMRTPFVQLDWETPIREMLLEFRLQDRLVSDQAILRQLQ